MKIKEQKQERKQEIKKDTKGITLIALVVTIIVLIILAGVSIAMVVGDNGIITQSQNAKEETEKAEVEEGVQTDILGIQVGKEGDITKGEFINILNQYFDGVPTEENLPEDLNDLILTSKEEYGGHEMNIGEIWNGTFTQVTQAPLKETVASTNYGDYVDYPIDLNGDGNTTNDWRIFYNDGEHVFIIAADYVPNTSNYLDNVGTGMSTHSSYSLYWNPAPTTAQTVNSDTLSLFRQSWEDYSTNVNGRCVSTLLNTNNWDGFVDRNYADCAIGGPTLEMWVKSWNTKGYTPLYTNTNTNGYYIGNTENPTTSSCSLSSDSGYNDTLYFPHQSSVSSCYGYWLASPSANSTSSLMYVNYSGLVSSSFYYSNISGCRPLVCLSSNITGAKGADNIWRF